MEEEKHKYEKMGSRCQVVSAALAEILEKRTKLHIQNKVNNNKIKTTKILQPNLKNGPVMKAGWDGGWWQGMYPGNFGVGMLTLVVGVMLKHCLTETKL